MSEEVGKIPSECVSMTHPLTQKIIIDKIPLKCLFMQCVMKVSHLNMTTCSIPSMKVPGAL